MPVESATAKSFKSQAYMEGFEDKPVDKSTPADTETAAKPAVNPTEAAAVTTAITKETIAKEDFQSATNELFKLGKMPSEHKEGPMLDAGGTLMKAMSSFDPDTTQKMTQEKMN
jgi:hypothetical protein